MATDVFVPMTDIGTHIMNNERASFADPNTLVQARRHTLIRNKDLAKYEKVKKCCLVKHHGNIRNYEGCSQWQGKVQIQDIAPYVGSETNDNRGKASPENLVSLVVEDRTQLAKIQGKLGTMMIWKWGPIS